MPTFISANLLPASVVADLVWPALYVAAGLRAWWVVGLSLVVEWPFVRFATASSWPRSAWTTVVANGASTVVGVIAIPIAGVAWEFLVTYTLGGSLQVRTFHPSNWVATYVIAALLNAAIESAILVGLSQGRGYRRVFLWLTAANALTVALAALWVYQEVP